MGNKFEREELYQLNQELKTKVNTLKDELYDAKSQIAKKDREIMRKEKIIEDCCKEIYNPSFSYQKSFDKAKESTLLSLCKEQYNQLKKDYDKLSEENNILNMNIKITKIKEYQIQINTLKSEMTKLTNLYKSAISENEILKRKINELIEFRKKYCQQHCIIDKCMKKVNDYNNNLIELELVNEDLKNELNKKLKLIIKKYEDRKDKNNDNDNDLFTYHKKKENKNNYYDNDDLNLNNNIRISTDYNHNSNIDDEFAQSEQKLNENISFVGKICKERCFCLFIVIFIFIAGFYVIFIRKNNSDK